MITTKRDAVVEDFLHMASIVGQPCALYQLAKANGVSPKTIQKHLRKAEVTYHIDMREVPA